MGKILTPIKAIRAHCLDCSCESFNEVKLCPIKEYSLYPYRLGKNPNIEKREYTEEQREAMRERLKASKLQKYTTLQSINTNGLPKGV